MSSQEHPSLSTINEHQSAHDSSIDTNPLTRSLPLPPPPPNESPFQYLDDKINTLTEMINQLAIAQQQHLHSCVEEKKYNNDPISSIQRDLTPHPVRDTNTITASPPTREVSPHHTPHHPPPPPHRSTASVISSPGTVSSNTTGRAYNGLVKFTPPNCFTGKPGDGPMSLINFISQMNRYLSAVGIDHYSLESLNVASMRLSDFASQWYDHISGRQPHLINSWSQLKEQLRDRYQPIAQEQLSFSSLLKVRYKNSIDTLNYEFLKHLQLLPEYNNSENENLMIGIYMNALTEAQGTTYICTTLRNAIAKKEVNTLTELQSMALLAESNLGKGNKTNIPYIAPHNRHNNNNKVPHRFQSGNSYRPSFKPFNRAPVSAPSFSTPAKLHNVQIEQHYDTDEDDTNEQSNTAGIDYENELNDDTSATPPFHEDVNESLSENDLAFLNAMRFYEKNAKRNPSLTTDELDRRRRTNTCFICNQPGHYANKCNASSQQQPKKL
jgi:hypothetical protein